MSSPLIHRVATATWIVLNGSIGILGNLLTLCAVPYAKHRQRFGFRPGWDGTSIAIMVSSNLLTNGDTVDIA